jgi:murein L,D-transpeptidase YcbB/YkuD
MLALSAAAACGVPAGPHPAPPPAPAPEGRAAEVSDFQAALDRHGVDLVLPQTGKAIVVNVPAFELIAFEDAEPVMRSRVIVGARATPTPILDTRTSVVRFRPTWRPTPSMVASGEYPDRTWPPGRRNPLGLAAIRLEPGLLVYLHDTNRRDLFDREARALSHGCIRVERWDEIVAWLLDMDRAEVRRLAEGGRTRDVATMPTPVLIRYYTRFPAGDGTLERFADIYGIAAEARGAAGDDGDRLRGPS